MHELSTSYSFYQLQQPRNVHFTYHTALLQLASASAVIDAVLAVNILLILIMETKFWVIFIIYHLCNSNV